MYRSVWYIQKWHYLTMRREETLWLLMGVNLTLNDLTSPGSRRRLYTKGLVDPSINPVLLFITDVWQTNKKPVRDKQLPHVSSAMDKRTVINGAATCQPADSLNSRIMVKSITLVVLTWFLWTWNSKVFVSMLMLDKFPNGNLENKNQREITVSFSF